MRAGRPRPNVAGNTQTMAAKGTTYAAMTTTLLSSSN